MKHKITHPMSRPGEADLSADVDFRYLKWAVREMGRKIGRENRKCSVHSHEVTVRH